MNDQLKKVKNPLFNVSVTGGTLEDFSQNAILLPAKEKPPPPTLNLSHEQILKDIIPNKDSSEVDIGSQQEHKQQSSFNFFDTLQIQQQEPSNFYDTLQQPGTVPQGCVPQPLTSSQTLPELSALQPHLSNPSQQGSHFSSVFSSFSNILNIGGSNNSDKEVPVPPPAGIESLISQERNSNPEPVPLFPASSPAVSLPNPPTTTGPVNVFRRSGQKRPTYAPIPGITSGTQTFPPKTSHQNIPPPQNLPPLPCTTLEQQAPPAGYFTPQNFSVTSLGPASSTTEPLPNQFKPISPIPSSGQSSHPIPQPLPTVSTYPIHFGQPSQPTNGSFLSPVMDAIPVSEAMQNSNVNNVSQAMPNQITRNEPVPIPGANSPVNQIYKPVSHHWFYQKESEGKKVWQPFSMVDSLALEKAFTSNDLDPDKVIATDGGRYDVNILRRQRTPVFWKGNPTEVRRCSWFHKGAPDGTLEPYEENVATMLEEQYRSAFEQNQWHKKIELGNGETLTFHGPDVLVLFPQAPTPDAWGNTPTQARPRVVKRGLDEFTIDEGEPAQVDHILFMVHGIGSVCDLKFRRVEEAVDEFRSIALQLVQSHYRSSTEKGKVNRVEVLPISWHDKLHSEETGIDKQLKSITLESIPKLRDFTNETLLDILFYTSPFYCQKIVSTVGNELNRIYDLFRQRNPDFVGGVSLGGHSLGSLILFDILCHQDSKPEEENGEQDDDVFPPKQGSKPPPTQRKISRRISYMMGAVGTGQPLIHYPNLNFEPKTFFALGSPIGMFVIVRGLDTLGENFSLPTCPAFFNIFHPYDPIAYRIESLIHPDLGNLKPVLIPHHKGRKRMHLELKDTMARLGADFKQKVIDSVKSTWNSFNHLGIFNKPDQRRLEEQVQEVIREQLENEAEAEEDPVQEDTDLPLGNLNNGRRVDYVLQEAPLEFINEYIFALTSHVCYWESEDTILLMLKEIYSSMDITTDSQIPQQSMTIERPSPSPTSLRSTNLNSIFQKEKPVGMDPTAPIQAKSTLTPPPMSGFVRKT